MWDLIVSVPDHCLSFYLDYDKVTFISSSTLPLGLIPLFLG